MTQLPKSLASPTATPKRKPTSPSLPPCPCLLAELGSLFSPSERAPLAERPHPQAPTGTAVPGSPSWRRGPGPVAAHCRRRRWRRSQRPGPAAAARKRCHVLRRRALPPCQICRVCLAAVPCSALLVASSVARRRAGICPPRMRLRLLVVGSPS